MKIKIIGNIGTLKMILGQFFTENDEFALLIDPEFIFAPRLDIFDKI
jgi:hypothetical protein